MLEEVCASDQPACQNFVQSHLEELQKALLGSLPSATSPAKRVRKRYEEMGCLLYHMRWRGFCHVGNMVDRCEGTYLGSVLPSIVKHVISLFSASSEVPLLHCQAALSRA